MSVDNDPSVSHDPSNSSLKDSSKPVPDHTELTAKLDTLLERYLYLLDEYQKARESLSQHLSSGYLSIARANFASPIKTRYGRDYYDDRMQAVRRVRLNEGGSCEIVPLHPNDVGEEEEPNAITSKGGDVLGEDAETKPRQQSTKAREKKQVGGMIIGQPDHEDSLDDNDELGQRVQSLHLSNSAVISTHESRDPPKPASDIPIPKPDQKTKKHKNDPIHMFGLLVPQALRQAQSAFVEAVEGSVPKVIEIDGEMRECEIEIRRTRKLLGKK